MTKCFGIIGGIQTNVNEHLRIGSYVLGILDHPVRTRKRLSLESVLLDAPPCPGTISRMFRPKQTSNWLRLAYLAGISLFAAAAIFGVFSTAHSAPTGQVEFHTVENGDTWTSVSARYLVPVRTIWIANGITNPRQLEAGQRLFIPGVQHIPAQGGRIIQTTRSPSILWASLENAVPVSSLLILNATSEPYQTSSRILAAPPAGVQIAEVGPTGEPESTVTLTPTSAPEEIGEAATAPPTAPPSSGGALRRSLLGIQGHFSIPDEDRTYLLDLVAYEMEFGWVKTQVDWSRIEYAPGQYSIELDKLDLFVDDAFNRNLRVLLSVAKAPDWARNTIEEDGPPTDYNRFYDFLRFLIQRYRFKIHAIEVWNEPNLRHDWNGATLNGGEYIRLLAGAYETIKREDGRLTVISAGLAPTGVQNEIALNDRIYLRQMYEAGLPNYTDVIGIHPYGWANPPWARCCGDSGGVPSHNDDPTFFFLNTIEDYRAIQTEFNDAGRQLWATEFGWGTMDGLDLPVPEEQPFFAYVNQEEQATYILEAYRMGQQMDFMGPMFLWNLNIATLDGQLNPNQAGYSILSIDVDRPRPAFRTLTEAPKSNE